MNLYEYSEIYVYINLSVQTHIRVTGISIHDTFHNVLRMHFIIGDFKLPSLLSIYGQVRAFFQGVPLEFGLTARVDGQKA